MEKNKINIENYNKGAKVLAEKFNRIGPRVVDIERALSFINKKNPKIIELGCGNGRDSSIILKHTTDFLGIDISSEMIKLSKENNPNGNFLIESIENFIFPENVDIIFAFASLLHLNKQEVRDVINKASQSLGVGGVSYISVKKDFYHEEIQKNEFGDRVFYFYELKDFQELIENTNLNIFYHEEQNILGVNWLTVVLKKV